MPEVTAVLGELSTDRSSFETEQMSKVEAAYNKSLEDAAQKLPALIDDLLHMFKTPAAMLTQDTQHGKTSQGKTNAGFRASALQQARSKPGGHELTARINLLPQAPLDPSLETDVKRIEQKREKDERNMFREAEAEMGSLVQIVANEVEAQVTQQINGLVHAMKFGSVARSSNPGPKAATFLQSRQPVLPSGPQLTTNVRIMASDEPFPTVGAMVEDMERRRDMGEAAIRTRVLEMELKLLKTANAIIQDRLDKWTSHMLQAWG